MASERLHPAVTVLGAGRMGSALVKAFRTAGHGVAVWNRDSAKAAVLADLGAQAFASAGAAVAACPVVVICVSDYRASRALFEPLRGGLAGKLVVQLTTGSPAEAEEFSSFLIHAGAVGLDGAVMAYPKDVGQISCSILLSGAQASYERAEPLMHALGRPIYVGERPGAASAMDGALLFYVHAASFAYFQSAALLMAQGYDWRGLAREIGVRPSVATLENWEAAIAGRSHVGSEATLDVHFAAFRNVASTADMCGLHRPLMRAVNDHFEEAVAAGFGGAELSAVFETFRPAASQ